MMLSDEQIQETVLSFNQRYDENLVLLCKATAEAQEQATRKKVAEWRDGKCQHTALIQYKGNTVRIPKVCLRKECGRCMMEMDNSLRSGEMPKEKHER